MVANIPAFPNSEGVGAGNIQSVTNYPLPTKKPKQRSVDLDDITFARYVSPWSRPQALSSDLWREWVLHEPIAMICRETINTYMLSLDWAITPRDSKYRDELAPTIKYYSRLIDRGGEYYGFDYTNLIEWILTDLQDLPFGSGSEVGRKGDSEGGRVKWVKPLDGGTLYPTLNRDYPIVQYVNGQFAVFPAHAIARTYMSPRTEIIRDGWGMAPPEKVYFALEMLARGDKYYANLLLDVPPAGILDLGDMEKESAMQWVKAYRSWTQGNTDAFAIPVLYEHTGDAKFVSFGKVPNDIMFDRITLKYAAIVASAYGMSLSDIGLQTTSASGETLAGSIRQERRTKRAGLARAKKKLKYFFESFLPDTLQFNFIDLDEEISVAKARAMLADSTAWKQYVETGMFSRKEARLSTLQTGLVPISLPEEPPADAEPTQNGNASERPGLLGQPQPASTGGQGEAHLSAISVRKSGYFDDHVAKFVGDMTNLVAPIFKDAVQGISEDDLYMVRSTINNSLFDEADVLEFSNMIQLAWSNKRWLKIDAGNVGAELKSIVEKRLDKYFEVELGVEDEEVIKNTLHRVDFDKIGDEFAENITDSIKDFIGRSAIFLLKDLILTESIFDTDDNDGYDSIVEQATTKLITHFDEFVDACVEIEAENTINEILRSMKDD